MILLINRALRVAAVASFSNDPLQTAAVVETASAVLPLLRPKTVGLLVAVAYAPSFANTLLKSAYSADPRLLKAELWLLSVLVVCELVIFSA